MRIPFNSFITFYLSIVLSLITYLGSAQNNLKITTDFDHLKVNEDGRLLAFKSGNIYKSDSFGGDWVLTHALREEDKYLIHPIIGNFGLFNVDTFLISGSLFDSMPSESGLFRTIDGGVFFQKVDLPYKGHIVEPTALFANKNGQAWATTHSDVYFTSDFGTNWRQIGEKARPEVKAARQIFFKDSLNGIFSAGEWGLFVTQDNCQSTQNLPTPYDQKKAISVSLTDSRHANTIYKVLMYNDWLIVQSGKTWFYSKSDSINWQILPINEVCLDSETNQLWGFDFNKQIVQFNNQLGISWTSPEKLDFDAPLSMQVVKGDLYFIWKQSVYKINTKETRHVLNYIKNTSIYIDAEHQDTAQSVVWGWDAYNLYQSENLGETWMRHAGLPNTFYQKNPFWSTDYENCRFNALNDSIISINEFYKMRRTQFNSNTNQFSPHQLTGIFDDFLKFKIKKVVVEKTKTACFAPWTQTTIVYQLDTVKNYFKSTYEAFGSHNDETKLQELRNKILYNRKHLDISKVHDFVKYLSQQPEKSLSWADFKDEHPDKKEALKQVLALKDTEKPTKYPKKPTKFQKKHRYWAYRYIDEDNPLFYPTVDTAFLQSIVFRNDYPDSLITEIFGYSRHELNGTYRQMTIENENGETIDIRQDLNYRTPANLVWVIQTKKWEFRTADKSIAEFIYSLSPKTFVFRQYRAPWQVYLDIAEYLYPKRAMKD
jgi:hypothetical protein